MWEKELGWVSIWMCDLLKMSLLWHWGFVFSFSFSYLRWADKIYCLSLSSGLIVTPVTNSSVTIGFHRFSQFHNLGGLWLWQKRLKIFCSSVTWPWVARCFRWVGVFPQFLCCFTISTAQSAILFYHPTISWYCFPRTLPLELFTSQQITFNAYFINIVLTLHQFLNTL